jgi:hypothetical protein
VELDGVVAARMNAQLWHVCRLPHPPQWSLAKIEQRLAAALPTVYGTALSLDLS